MHHKWFEFHPPAEWAPRPPHAATLCQVFQEWAQWQSFSSSMIKESPLTEHRWGREAESHDCCSHSHIQTTAFFLKYEKILFLCVCKQETTASLTLQFHKDPQMNTNSEEIKKNFKAWHRNIFLPWTKVVQMGSHEEIKRCTQRKNSWEWNRRATKRLLFFGWKVFSYRQITMTAMTLKWCPKILAQDSRDSS